MESSPVPQRISRVLHWFGELTSRASAAVAVAAVLVGFNILLTAEGSSSAWQVEFSTVAESIALVMLFVIQHTQSRQQTVVQLKLDELIRSSPHADDRLVHIEVAPDDELIELEQDQVAHHESVRESENGDDDGPGD